MQPDACGLRNGTRCEACAVAKRDAVAYRTKLERSGAQENCVDRSAGVRSAYFFGLVGFGFGAGHHCNILYPLSAQACAANENERRGL